MTDEKKNPNEEFAALGIRVKDCYVTMFIGREYRLEKGETTIGYLRCALEAILDDLPEDDNLEVAEVICRDGYLSYILKDGIMQ